ncbi:hypothetical protein DHEL01_v212797 [Diaporthe helianthi]|uniref:Tat pathway signal sequence n=1 Tax=Diaporthe helianthi TaxID=158607 RepID=A0A2P5HEY7_DIAHE|nr:hypothetical protein DHEL01_v212797 [Diaporthe helianthi]
MSGHDACESSTALLADEQGRIPLDRPTLDSPASEAVSWRVDRLHIGLNDSNAFRGDPREELDASWDHLLSDEETLHKIGRTSAVALEDNEGGYLAELAVFHQLHCLRMIRASYNLDVYPYFQPLLAPKNGEVVPLHIDHCIDALRQALMCKPDLTLLVSDWRDDYRNPWLDFGSQRECVNWDNIFKWSKAHHVDWHGKLRHPKYGPTHWEEQPEAKDIDYSKLKSGKSL